MDESSDRRTFPKDLDPDSLREILGRAVRRVCPTWLAGHREDLVQKACLRVTRKMHESEEPVSLGASYLWKVAHSVVMDEIRSHRRRPEVELDSPGVAEPVSDAGSPEKHRSAAELREAINAGVKRLIEPRRWAVLLFLYGFSLQDSARMLGWNAKRVDNQRYQGLAELRVYLRQRGLEP